MNSKKLFFFFSLFISGICIQNLDAMLGNVIKKPLYLGYLKQARGLTNHNINHFNWRNDGSRPDGCINKLEMRKFAIESDVNISNNNSIKANSYLGMLFLTTTALLYVDYLHSEYYGDEEPTARDNDIVPMQISISVGNCVNKASMDGYTLVCWSSITDNYEIVRLLTNAGIDTGQAKTEDLKEFTEIVHILANASNVPTEMVANSFKTKTAKEYVKLGHELLYASPQKSAQLIQMNADINYIDWLTYSPLDYAILFRQVDKVKLLIDSGADLYLQDKFGKTPLDQVLELINNYHCSMELRSRGFIDTFDDNKYTTYESLKNLETIKAIIEEAMQKEQK